MDLSEILSMVSTWGGVTTVTTVIGGWMWRNVTKRLKEAEAALAEANVAKAKMDGKADEFHYYKEQLTEAQKTIIDLQHAMREERADHYSDMRETEERYEARLRKKDAENASKDALIHEKNEKIRQYHDEFAESEKTINGLYERQLVLEKENADLRVEVERVRCEDLPCPFRIPPNAHTRPHTGQTKEEYHSQRRIPMINLNKD